MSRPFSPWAVALRAVVAAIALPIAGPALAQPTASTVPARCDRACIADLVAKVLVSMPRHDPDALPMAAVYAATENSHPAALGMMTAWRTITTAGKPALLAIDVGRGGAYFALPVSEGGSRSVLWGRIQVKDRRIAELEIFLNRSRGDHGFSFSADRLRANYAKLTTLPVGRTKTAHDELEKIARASFDAKDPYQLEAASDCQFSEVGSLVVDPGLDDVPPPAGGPPPNAPLGCLFPPFRPSDPKARVIAVDDETGLVVVAAVIPGTVFPYPFRGHMMSAFIPSDMKEPAQAQAAWIERKAKAGKTGLVAPLPATAEVMQVIQVYDGKMHASQINVYLAGPDMRSVWAR